MIQVTDHERILLALAKAESGKEENICRSFVAILAGTFYDTDPELSARLTDLANKDVDLCLAEKYRDS